MPKVADWGLSKHLLEHSQSIEGLSTHYAAPEQFDSDSYGTPDHVTDIYQVGVVLYELFTRRKLFEGGKLEILDQIRNEQPTPPSEAADVPAELDDVLLPALAKEKSDRYEEIVYLRDSLRQLQQAAQSQA